MRTLLTVALVLLSACATQPSYEELVYEDCSSVCIEPATCVGGERPATEEEIGTCSAGLFARHEEAVSRGCESESYEEYVCMRDNRMADPLTIGTEGFPCYAEVVALNDCMSLTR